MMKKRAALPKLIITIVAAILLVVLLAAAVMFLALSNSRDNQDPAKQEEMMALVLEWGRLSTFPANASHVFVETEGKSFTRSFHASFVAPQEDIQTWIKDSPGLNETTPEELSDNKVRYIIEPGGGANRAEVTIDYGLNQVKIYVSWG